MCVIGFTKVKNLILANWSKKEQRYKKPSTTHFCITNAEHPLNQRNNVNEDTENLNLEVSRKIRVFFSN